MTTQEIVIDLCGAPLSQAALDYITQTVRQSAEDASVTIVLGHVPSEGFPRLGLVADDE